MKVFIEFGAIVEVLHWAIIHNLMTSITYNYGRSLRHAGLGSLSYVVHIQGTSLPTGEHSACASRLCCFMRRRRVIADGGISR